MIHTTFFPPKVENRIDETLGYSLFLSKFQVGLNSELKINRKLIMPTRSKDSQILLGYCNLSTFLRIGDFKIRLFMQLIPFRPRTWKPFVPKYDIHTSSLNIILIQFLWECSQFS